MPTKKVVVISDLHCGHVVGLTPTQWQSKKTKARKHDKWVAIQSELYQTYLKTIRKQRPIDLLIVNGDCIDGKGQRSGGTEQITADRDEQCEMAKYCIRMAEARKIIMTYGTAYHAGESEDYEDQIARDVDAKIGAHDWIDVNGVIFDVKHHIGSSAIPHGRLTPIAREQLWNGIWSEYQEQPKADILIRSHVHYHAYCGGPTWVGMTTPALQGMGSKFGARRMSGHVDWGFVVFEIASNGEYIWWPEVTRIKAQKARVVKV